MAEEKLTSLGKLESPIGVFDAIVMVSPKDPRSGVDNRFWRVREGGITEMTGQLLAIEADWCVR